MPKFHLLRTMEIHMIIQERMRSGYFGIDMGITGVPETFIVDEEGIIVLRHVGPIDFSNEILNR